MPFMKGSAPIRRTLKYLESGKIVFRERVKIFTLNYNVKSEDHKGARDFAFWHVPQLQYKNPNVQVLTFKNMTPSPFIRCFLDEGNEVLMDIDRKDKDEIHDHLKKILGKSDEVLAMELKSREQTINPANFGAECQRHCICEIPGQVPCPRIVELPRHMRMKFTGFKGELIGKELNS